MSQKPEDHFLYENSGVRGLRNDSPSCNRHGSIALENLRVMETTVFIVCVVFAAFFLWLAFLHFGREKYPTSVMFGLVSVVLIFGGLPWFQGFVKTWVVSNVNSKLKELGSQVDTVDRTTREMHDQLRAHQTELATTQRDITNQFSKIIALQTNLDAQATKLGDVEYWMHNLYRNMEQETYSMEDTNNFLIVPQTNGAYNVICLLERVPIPASFEVFAKSADSAEEHLLGRPIKNVFTYRFIKYDSNTLRLTFRYVIDSRETNIFRRLPIPGKEILLGDKNWAIGEPPSQ